jgi:hypothetical protein
MDDQPQMVMLEHIVWCSKSPHFIQPVMGSGTQTIKNTYFFLTVIQTRLANLLTKTRRLGGGDQ